MMSFLRPSRLCSKLNGGLNPFRASSRSDSKVQSTRKRFSHYTRPKINPKGIFANSELALGDIQVYGFDYDFTLCNYSDLLQPLIYQSVVQHLVNQHGYPSSLLFLEYDPSFAIRGLQYDMKKGLLMKMNNLNTIMPDTVYYGRKPLSPEKLHEAYNGNWHVSQAYMPNIRPMADLFCLPEICLISDIIQYFSDTNVDFDPAYVYQDVRRSTEFVHQSQLLHRTVLDKIDKYLIQDPQISKFLRRLKAAGKKTFLLSNSPYHYVDQGLKHLIPDSDWKELFDVCITSADKPNFYTSDRPFRSLDPATGQISWQKVDHFDPNVQYVGGNLQDFTELSGWKANVLYLGDHVHADLQVPSRTHGWRTGVIVKELEREIQILDRPEYQKELQRLVNLEHLMERRQLESNSNSNNDNSIDSNNNNQSSQREQIRDELSRIEAEIKESRRILKTVFNPNFGSAFRTYHNATLFSFNVQRFADLYTSAVENFLTYPVDFIFYPQRKYLPHEPKVHSELADQSKYERFFGELQTSWLKDEQSEPKST